MKRIVIVGLFTAGNLLSYVQAATGASAPAMDNMLSYSALTGLRLAAKPEKEDTEEDIAIKKCIRALDSSAFHNVMEAFLTRRFNTAELASMEKFMSSSAGVKYAKNRILAGHAIVNEAQPEPLEELSQNELKEIDKFLSSPLGQKLSSPNGLWDEAAEQAISLRSQELFEGCVPK